MPRKPDLFVLVADATRAELLRRQRGNPPFATVATFDNPDSRLPDRAFGTERPGRAHESVGPRRSAIESRSSPRVRVLAAFATELAAAIERAVEAGRSTQVVVAAPPRLLRMIEARLNPEAGEAVTRTVPKDLTRLPRLTLMTRLADELVPQA
jgi:protein required for attachment to host cells